MPEPDVRSPGAAAPEPRRIPLPARMDLPAAEELAEALEHLRGTPVLLDGAGVERPGGLYLQLLVIACRQWRAEGLAFRLAGASPALADALRLLDLARVFEEEAAPCR